MSRQKTKLEYTFEITSSIGKVKWNELFIRKVIACGLLNSEDIENIQYNIRDYGNFGTHLAERRDEEFNPDKEYKWTKQMEGAVKVKISHDEAKEVLEYTKKYLIIIITNYFNKLQ